MARTYHKTFDEVFIAELEEIVIDKNGEINHLGGANKMLEDKYEWR